MTDIDKTKNPGAVGGAEVHKEAFDTAKINGNCPEKQGLTFERRKSDREKWTAKTFTRPDGKSVFDYRLSRQNSLGEFVGAKSNGVAIGLITNIEQIPRIALDLLAIYYAAKGGAQ